MPLLRRDPEIYIICDRAVYTANRLQTKQQEMWQEEGLLEPPSFPSPSFPLLPLPLPP